MQQFEFYCPTEIVFGKGAEERAAEKIRKHGGSRVLVVYGGGSVVRSGLLARLERVLSEGALAYGTLGGVQPNPRMGFAREGVAEAIRFGADFVLGVGGGSAIDTAKAIAHGTANPGTDIGDFWSGKAPLERSLPIGAVLTIPAAGSECSDSSVLTNEATGKKAGLASPLNRPAVALMNPELAFTLPREQIACGLSDILMHTLERYFTPVEGNEFTDLVAEALLRNVMAKGRLLMAHRKDYDAMSEVMWCGTVSHNGFTGLGRPKDFSVHKLGHELGGKYDVAHGASLTALWGSWARYVYEDNPARFARFAEQVFGVNSGSPEERARAGIRRMEEFFREIGMPLCFSELGIGVQPEEALAQLADSCTSGSARAVGVFRPIDRKAALDIYRMANR